MAEELVIWNWGHEGKKPHSSVIQSLLGFLEQM